MRYSFAIGYDTAGFFFVSSTNVPGLKARAKHVPEVIERATAAARHLLSRQSVGIHVNPGIMVRDGRLQVTKPHELQPFFLLVYEADLVINMDGCHCTV